MTICTQDYGLDSPCLNAHCGTFTRGYVYALVDERIGDIFYVGSTIQPPGIRYQGHMRASRKSNFREAWILSILASGSLPLLCSLGEYETSCEQELKEIEHSLADALHKIGHTALCDTGTLVLHGRIAEHLDRINEQARIAQWLRDI